MEFVNKLITRIKGQPYKLDSQIKMIDLIIIIYNKIGELIRGTVTCMNLMNKPNKLFIGRGVKLKHKKLINMLGNITIGDFVEINALSKKGVELGNNIKIGNYSIISCTGSLQNLGQGIKIGDNFGCGDWCFFGAAGGIEIGNNVIMGQNVRFHSENHNFDRIDIPIRSQGVNNKGIKIGNDCWIGAGVVFLDGVKVGDGCVIGANTVVNKDVPNYSIAVGNPVKIIKSRMEI